MNKTQKLLEEIELISSFITNFNISEDFIEDLNNEMGKTEEPTASVVVIKDDGAYNGFSVFIMSPNDTESITSDIWVSREFAWEVNDNDIVAEFGYLLALTVEEYKEMLDKILEECVNNNVPLLDYDFDLIIEKIE